MTGAIAEEYLTRAVVFSADPTQAQERLLQSYCGAARFAHNWALGQVKDNLATRTGERESGIAQADLTPSQSWSAFSLNKAWNAAKEAATWWPEVSMHAFRSGVVAAAAGLENYRSSKKGTRKGRPVGFPRFKSRDRTNPSVTFTEINHQASWFEDPDVLAGRVSPNGHRIRLMLAEHPGSGGAAPSGQPGLDPHHRVHSAPVHEGGRQHRLHPEGHNLACRRTLAGGGAGAVSGAASGSVSCAPWCTRPIRPDHRHRGRALSIAHLATLSRPVPGLTDAHGHIANPRVLEKQLGRWAKVDRRLARCQKGSKNRTKVKRRRARMHDTITKARSLELHRVSNALANQFDVIAIVDPNLAGMANAKRHLGRALAPVCQADASLAELRRQLT